MLKDLQLKPHPRRLIGELLERGELSTVLWTPNGDHKQGELMRVLSIGDRAHDFLPGVAVGHVVVLNPERYGSTFSVEDLDTHMPEHYHIVNADDVLAIYTGDVS